MAITRSIPAGSRATRLTVSDVPGNATSTEWNIVPTFDSTFTLVITASGSTSGNILSSGLTFIDIWLPPSQTYTARTRHGLSTGNKTAWSARTSFESRRPLNSYDKYLALSGLGGVDNVITE